MIRTKQKLSNRRLGFESKMLISKAETNIYDPKVGSGRGRSNISDATHVIQYQLFVTLFLGIFYNSDPQSVTKFVLIYFLILVSAV